MPWTTTCTDASRGVVLISVHDVTAATLSEVRWLLERLDDMVARPRNLLVIPCDSERDDIRRHPELLQLLHREILHGSEIVLHGYTHRRAGAWAAPLLTRARAALFARQVAEFASLPWPQQRARLLAGREVLSDVGINTRGFCAPGWLSTAELPGLLAETGFRYLVEMSSVYDLDRRHRMTTPWLGYMGVGRVHEVLVGAGAVLLAPWRQRSPAVSVFLHPQGAPGSSACARVLRDLARLLSDRTAVTYGELLESTT